MRSAGPSSLAGIYAMRLGAAEHATRTAEHGMLGDILEGLRYVRGHAGIGPLFLLMAIGAICIRPLQDLLPGFADQVFKAGPQGLGLAHGRHGRRRHHLGDDRSPCMRAPAGCWCWC